MQAAPAVPQAVLSVPVRHQPSTSQHPSQGPSAHRVMEGGVTHAATNPMPAIANKNARIGVGLTVCACRNEEPRSLWRRGVVQSLSNQPPESVELPGPHHGAFAPVDHEETELLAAVYAQPDDDRPRLVYADYLMERNDPRGRLIALQCRPRRGPKRRSHHLLTHHERLLLGPLNRALGPHPRIARGFLAEGWARFASEADFARLCEHPAWATLECLSGFDRHGEEFLLRCPLTNLRRVRPGLSLCLLERMARRARPYERLERLSVQLLARDVERVAGRLEGLSAASSLPRLVELDVAADVASTRLLLGTLARSALGRRLKHLRLTSPAHTLPLAELCAFAQLESLEVGVEQRCLLFVRDQERWRVELRCSAPPLAVLTKALEPHLERLSSIRVERRQVQREATKSLLRDAFPAMMIE